MLIDGEKVMDFLFYDEEREKFSIKSGRIIDFLETYSVGTVPIVEDSRWIPCEERLPEPGHLVLISVLCSLFSADDKEKIVGVSRLKEKADGGEYSFWGYSGEWYEVVAWMPLPTFYERSEE